MSRFNPYHPIGYVLVPLLAGLGCLWMYHQVLSPETAEGFLGTIAETLFQVAVVGAVGAAIARIYEHHKAMEAFRLEVLRALGEAHAAIYEIRRALLLGSTDAEVVRKNLFRMMAVRNQLGQIGHEARGRELPKREEVLTNLGEMRDHLGTLVDETMGRLIDGTAGLGPLLEAFVKGSRTSAYDAADDYRVLFKAPYLRAKEAADPSWKERMTAEQRQSAALRPS